MKHILVFTVIFICWAAASGAQPRDTLSVGWEPMEGFQSIENDVPTGIDFDMLTAIAREAGIELKFELLPWSRVLKMIETGSIDMTCAASKLPERELYANFSDSYRNDVFSLFIRTEDTGRFSFKSFADMKQTHFTLGTIIQTYYGPEFTTMSNEPWFRQSIDETSTDEQNFNKLSHHHIDGVLCDPLIGNRQLTKMKLGKTVVKSPLSYTSGAVYYMFSKKTVYPETIARFNAGLKAIRANGTYARILESYYGKKSANKR